MRTLAVVQARVGSTRLPGKVLLPLAGTPMLERQLERIFEARTAFDLVVATTWEQADEPIAALCQRLAVACFRGHPTDLLDRHYQAARELNAAVVVKIPSDCPLIDPDAIDRVLAFFEEHPGRYDYVSNLHPATYPDGNDVEVLTFQALESAWHEAERPHEREHTTPFVWDRPGRFRLGNVLWETGLDLSRSHRFTVDYPEDLAFVSAVYEALGRTRRAPFRLHEILAFLDSRPAVMKLNAAFAGVNWYRHHLDELTTIAPDETCWPQAQP